MLDVPVEELLLRDEAVHDSKGNQLSLADIACNALYTEEQFQIQAQASFVPEESPPPFIAQFAEVEVDTQTGEVTVLRFVSAVDCGQALNPILAEGQVEGAVLNGISYALCEAYQFDAAGRMTNPRFWDYKIFTTRDLPELITLLVETHEPTGPFGAKSVGEIAINGPAPAIANAIFDAVGVRLFSLPMTPEKVWRALQALQERARPGHGLK
jgi:CO/xanthine dehydrogenase Mo-binding subunit